MDPPLDSCTTTGATALYSDNILLSIPACSEQKYAWAQLDDYRQKSRSQFVWQAPVSISLHARCSNAQHLGTWGFGLWNDPFSANIGIGGTARRLPALPNCTWFFYASNPNHLEIYDHYPAQGFLAATFSAPLIPPPLLLPALPFAALLALPFTSRLLRKFLRRFIKQDAALITIDPTSCHKYKIDWLPEQVKFFVDDNLFYQTDCSPRGPLGLVLWVDNQFAAYPKSGRLRFGTLKNEVKTELEIYDLSIHKI
jgi:hypothetical protein